MRRAPKPDGSRRALALAALGDGNLGSAIEHAAAAIHADPLDADSVYYWALAQHLCGRLEKARQGYAAAIQLHPEHVLARGNLGSLRLWAGDFSREAWSLYLANVERRSEDGRSLGVPLWNGEDIRRKTVLALGHNGLGDQIMFASCLPDLAERAGKLIVCLEPRLVSLFARALPQAQVEPMSYLKSAAWERDKAEVDACAPLARIAMEYRSDFGKFHGGSYLAPDPARVGAWRRRLDALGPGRRVGLSWRGGTPETRRAQRSMDIARLEPLLGIAGIHFVSLQYGAVAGEIEEWNRAGGTRLHHWQEAIEDYEETAALAACLDQVVTVTTSLVHLCGALGIEVSVLVDASAQWRYGAKGDRMPWYSSARLYRQSASGDWSKPLDECAARLRA